MVPSLVLTFQPPSVLCVYLTAFIGIHFASPFQWGTFLKDLWREGFLVADETCAAGSDVDAPTCGFTCDGTRGEEMITELASM